MEEVLLIVGFLSTGLVFYSLGRIHGRNSIMKVVEKTLRADAKSFDEMLKARKSE